MLRAVSSMGDRACRMGGPEAGQAAGPGHGCSFSSCVFACSSVFCLPFLLCWVHTQGSSSCILPDSSVPFPNILELCISVTKLRSSLSEAWPSAPLSMDLVVERKGPTCPLVLKPEPWASFLDPPPTVPSPPWSQHESLAPVQDSWISVHPCCFVDF